MQGWASLPPKEQHQSCDSMSALKTGSMSGPLRRGLGEEQAEQPGPYYQELAWACDQGAAPASPALRHGSHAACAE